MKVVKEPEHFRATIVCKQIRDKFGYVWAREENYCGATLEIEATDIFRREWNKYSEKGVDYGVNVLFVVHLFLFKMYQIMLKLLQKNGICKTLNILGGK